MSFTEDDLKVHVPYYLSAEDKVTLIDELKAISQGGQANYYLSPYHDEFKAEMLQGDGWSGFTFFVHQTKKLIDIKALVLSNSCDIDPENPRDIPTRVVYAPLVKLAAFEQLLSDSQLPKDKVASKIDSIRAQKTTNIFYLPAGGPLTDEYIVRLDESQSIPRSMLEEGGTTEKLLTLSNTGFYMLIFKISIHFCRLHEKVNRTYQAAS
ncbi:hypothetical protein ACVDG9_24680 [Roseibium sp. RP-7]